MKIILNFLSFNYVIYEKGEFYLFLFTPYMLYFFLSFFNQVFQNPISPLLFHLLHIVLLFFYQISWRFQHKYLLESHEVLSFYYLSHNSITSGQFTSLPLLCVCIYNGKDKQVDRAEQILTDKTKCNVFFRSIYV